MRESSCGKVRAFESSRARQFSCAAGVPGHNGDRPRLWLINGDPAEFCYEKRRPDGSRWVNAKRAAEQYARDSKPEEFARANDSDPLA